MRVPQAPTWGVLALVATGLLLAGRGHWRLGSGVLAGALLLAAVLRLSLSPRAAGWLVVRSRAFDATLLVLLGLGVGMLAVTIPRP